MSQNLRHPVRSLRRCVSSPMRLAAVGLLFIVIGNAIADEKVDRTELPKLADMPIPTAEELFTADENDKEFDWIVQGGAWC